MPRAIFFRRAAWVPVLLIAWGNVWSQGTAGIPNGSIVTFRYVLKVDDRVQDSGAMKIIQGAGQIIPGLEEELKNLRVGDKKLIVVPPVKGYGEVNPELFQNVPKRSFKGRSKLKLNSVVTGRRDGRQFRAVIVGQDDKNFFLDLNHPLAGKILKFDIELVDVKPPAKGP